MCKPAFLPKFTRHPVKGFCFPGIIPLKKENNVNGGVEGILLTGLSQEELAIFDWFEDDDYTRSVKQIWVTKVLDNQEGVSVVVSDSTTTQLVDANVYIWSSGEQFLDLEQDWDYDKFRRMKLDWYLKSTVRPSSDSNEN